MAGWLGGWNVFARLHAQTHGHVFYLVGYFTSPDFDWMVDGGSRDEGKGKGGEHFANRKGGIS